MLRVALFLLGILGALVALSACGGGPAPTPDIPLDTAATEPVPATPTEPAATASTSTRLPGTRAATARPAATQLLPTATQPPATEPPAPLESAEEDVAAIRRIAYDYWVALNDYNVDRALPMLEESYRAREEETIRNDIGRMKLFRVKLGVSEETPPTLNADGDYETYLSMKTPVDTRTVLMVFRHIEGQWRIIFSGEVE